MTNSRSNMFEVYKKVKKSGDIEKNPYEIVKLILNELSRSMLNLSNNIERKKKAIEKKNSESVLEIQKSISKHVTRTLTTIYSLQTTLDFEKGGNLANSLFQLYEYCRLQIIKGFTKSLNQGILKAKEALDKIISAWDNMSFQENK
jgi:flagellar protein FliS